MECARCKLIDHLPFAFVGQRNDFDLVLVGKILLQEWKPLARLRSLDWQKLQGLVNAHSLFHFAWILQGRCVSDAGQIVYLCIWKLNLLIYKMRWSHTLWLPTDRLAKGLFVWARLSMNEESIAHVIRTDDRVSSVLTNRNSISNVDSPSNGFLETRSALSFTKRLMVFGWFCGFQVTLYSFCISLKFSMVQSAAVLSWFSSNHFFLQHHRNWVFRIVLGMLQLRVISIFCHFSTHIFVLNAG